MWVGLFGIVVTCSSCIDEVVVSAVATYLLLFRRGFMGYLFLLRLQSSVLSTACKVIDYDAIVSCHYNDAVHRLLFCVWYFFAKEQ